jgi:hypothetical protein
MKKHFYIGLIVFAVLLLALGRLIVRPPVARVWRTARRSVKAPERRTRPAPASGLAGGVEPTFHVRWRSAG